MRVMVDVNVVLDVLLAREPHAIASASLLASIERGALTGLFSASSVDTVFYLLKKELGAQDARQKLAVLVRLFSMATVDQSVIHRAISSGWSDLEDAVVYQAALEARADYLVTRDKNGFKSGVLPVLTPEQFLESRMST